MTSSRAAPETAPGDDRQLAYWRRQLAGSSLVLELPTDHPRPAAMSRRSADLPVELPRALGEALQELSRREGVTLFVTLLAALQTLLHRYTGQEEIIVGSPGDRPHRGETEGLAGSFINPLVLRGDLSGNPTFRTLLQRMQEVCLGALAHQDVPFETLVEELQPTRDRSRSPLCQVLLVLQNPPARPINSGAGEFDLTLELWETNGTLCGRLGYCTALFTEARMRRLLEHFQVLLEGIVADPDQHLGELPLLSAAERQQLVVTWNDTRRDYPLEHTRLHQLVEAQVGRTPEATAVEFESHQLSYRELNQRANQLAHALRKRGVGPDQLVGVCMERSLEMVVGLLGILKAGGAYVPLDPEYPKERLAFMMEDASVPVLLTQHQLVGALPPHHAQVICLDTAGDLLAGESDTNPAEQTTPDHLAYMIYTSGSTGKPKGAMNTHRGIGNRLLWMQEQYPLSPADAVMQKTPFSFDVSVWEFFWPLLAGARLVVARPGGHQDPEYLLNLIAQQQITVMHSVPSMLQVFVEAAGLERCHSLRHVICSGEALPYELQERFFAKLPAQLHNLYGPTEAAVDVTSWTCQRGGALRVVPIGRPVANTRCYILDARLQPVPIGVAGELHLGGVQIGRGYHRRPELTAAKFLPDPFRHEPGARLYKTGDVARHLPDGAIEYLGRLDHQVKIRGFRIELGEIESVLNRQPAVRESCVVAQSSGGDKRLIGYIVTRPPASVSTSELREFLKRDLPEYMVPAVFVFLDAFPLSPNGKVDRRALPAPERARPELRDAYVAPQTPEEKLLAEIWQDVLEVQPIGLDDNFFELGGDSIRVIQVLARARQKGLTLTLAQLFAAGTIRKLVLGLEPDRGAAARPAPVAPFSLISPADRALLPAGLEDAYPMVKLQVGMFYHNELNPASAVFHDVFSFGIRFPFVREKLEAALQRYAQRHAPARTSFDLGGYSEPLQLAHRDATVPFTVEDLRDLTPDEQTPRLVAWLNAERRRPFDRAQAPLLRVHAQLHTADRFQLIVSFHHVILDGWSLAAMLTEVLQDYSALIKGTGETVPPVRVPYRDYVALERETMASEPCQKFWRDYLQDANIQMLPRWPKSYCAGGPEQVRGPELQIPREVFAGLKRLAQTAGVPLKSVLQAAHYRALSLMHGASDVVSGLVTNGRPEQIDGERMGGLFLNTIPLRLQMPGGTWIDLARQVFAAERELIPFRRMPLTEIQRLNGGQRLFETVFDFVHFHVYRNLSGYQDLGFMEGHYFEANDFTIIATFMLDVTMTELQVHFDYDPEQLTFDQIRAMGDYYVNILTAMAAEPTARYETFSPLTAAERDQVVVQWNDTRVDYPREVCLHQLFEAQVARTPEAVAVVFADQQLTYRQLDARANQLAHHLRSLGVGVETFVGLCLERSLEMVVGIYGTLKAGAAYVPIDPSYPPDRRAFMLQDAKAPVLLTQEKLRGQLPSTGAQVVCLDTAWPAISRESTAAPEVGVTAENLAYMIYTSGSTGQPKGAMNTHRGICNRLLWMQDEYRLSAVDVILQKTPFSFDVSVWELFWPLLAGARLVMAQPGGHRDPGYLVNAIAQHRITVLHFVPSMLQVFLEAAGLERCGTLRHVICSGEALPFELQERFFARLSGQLHNLYGPTEAAVDVTAWACQRDSPRRVVPIGRPIANTQCYILDARLAPVPVGVAGELHLGGVQIGRGYHHRPELTGEKFIPDPFRSEPGARLYKTGDRARHWPDGTIEYLGRLDRQVKIRGFRIELEEIQLVLEQQGQVRASVVVAREDVPGDQQLVAYVVVQGAEAPTAAELRSYLGKKLPEYMVPAAFVMLAALPLSPNGKVDYRALPAPDRQRRDSDRPFVAPRTPTEQAVAAIWTAVLKVEKIGVHDHFTELGGHSLLATQIVSRVRQTLRVGVSLRQLFDAPTVAESSAIIEVLQKSRVESARPLIPRLARKTSRVPADAPPR